MRKLKFIIDFITETRLTKMTKKDDTCEKELLNVGYLTNFRSAYKTSCLYCHYWPKPTLKSASYKNSSTTSLLLIIFLGAVFL